MFSAARAGRAGTRGDALVFRGDFAAFYRASLPEVYAYVLHRCGTRSVAEDIVQETYLAAVKALNTNSVDELNIRWLIGVARYKILDHFRRQSRSPRTADEPVDEVVTSDAALDAWSLEPSRDGVQTALDALTPVHRMVLLLRHLDGYPVTEIASAIGKSVHATESLLVRARQTFKRRYVEVLDG